MGEFVMNLKSLAVAAVCVIVTAAIVFGVIEIILTVDLRSL